MICVLIERINLRSKTNDGNKKGVENQEEEEEEQIWDSLTNNWLWSKDKYEAMIEIDPAEEYFSYLRQVDVRE